MTQSNWSPKYTELRDANGVLKQRTVQREEDGPIEILYQSPEHDVPKIGCVNHDCDRCRALQALHDENERLGLYKDAYAQPEQEPLEYRNAVEGWVKIDEVREHFNSVGCATIYKTAGEGRVPLSLCKAQPEQEPVAYIKSAELEELKHCNGMGLWAENAAVHTDDSISKQLLPSGHVPVYTTPPQRKPLTDEQILEILCIRLMEDDDIEDWRDEINGARAIEAAHGIKGNT
jgi:hypothetical protein